MWFVNGRHWKIFFLRVSFICGWEDRALQKCNLSARLSVDCRCILCRHRCKAVPADPFRRMPQQATAQSDKLIANHTLELNWAWVRLGFCGGAFGWRAGNRPYRPTNKRHET